MIIAIDPGPDKSAVLQWDGERVINPRILPNEDLRMWVKKEAPPWQMAVEMVACYGMPVGAEVFNTVLFIGALQEIWKMKFRLVYRREVKIHLCGSMKAKDANIRQSLVDRYGKPGTKKNPGKLYGISSHLWSALAVAVTAVETNESGA